MADSASPISSSKAVCHWSGDSTTPSIVLNNSAYTLRIERALSSRTELGTSGRSRPYITTSGSELSGTLLVLVPYCTVLMENSCRTRGASGECHRRLRPVPAVHHHVRIGTERYRTSACTVLYSTDGEFLEDPWSFRRVPPPTPAGPTGPTGPTAGGRRSSGRPPRCSSGTATSVRPPTR